MSRPSRPTPRTPKARGTRSSWSSSTRSSRTTRGLPSGPRRCSCPGCRASRSSLQPIYDNKRRGPGLQPRPSFYCLYTGPLTAAAGLRSAMTAQLADQHPTAENHHGDRPEGGGQEDVGAAGLRQVLLPGRGGGLRGGGLPALGQPDNSRNSPATGVAARIGLLIVGPSVDHERAAVGVEYRVLTRERYPVGERLIVGGPVLVHDYLLEVARVRAFGVLEPVLGIRRVKVLAGGLEVRRGAPGLVDVNAVLAWSECVLSRLQVGGDGHPVGALRKGRVPHRVAICILQLCRGRAPTLGQCNTDTKS